ncbi:MAG: MarR family winged helix-turn-helix transcriptional regulator [Balneolaceae bacterium]
MGTHYKGTAKEEKTLDAFIKLMRASETISNRLNRHLADAGLTASQFGVLEALYHLGSLNQRALAEKLLKSGGNITMVIDNLEKSDLVIRKRDPKDRRSIQIYLTPQGKKLIKKIFPEHLERIVEIFNSISEKDKTELSRICKQLGLDS